MTFEFERKAPEVGNDGGPIISRARERDLQILFIKESLSPRQGAVVVVSLEYDNFPHHPQLQRAFVLYQPVNELLNNDSLQAVNAALPEAAGACFVVTKPIIVYREGRKFQLPVEQKIVLMSKEQAFRSRLNRELSEGDVVEIAPGTKYGVRNQQRWQNRTIMLAFGEIVSIERWGEFWTTVVRPLEHVLVGEFFNEISKLPVRKTSGIGQERVPSNEFRAHTLRQILSTACANHLGCLARSQLNKFLREIDSLQFPYDVTTKDPLSPQSQILIALRSLHPTDPRLKNQK